MIGFAVCPVSFSCCEMKLVYRLSTDAEGKTIKLLDPKCDGILRHILPSRACVCFGQSHQMMLSLCCFSSIHTLNVSVLPSLEEQIVLHQSLYSSLLFFFWGVGEVCVCVVGWMGVSGWKKGWAEIFMLNYGYWIGNFEIGLFFSLSQKFHPFFSCEISWARKQGFSSFSIETH